MKKQLRVIGNAIKHLLVEKNIADKIGLVLVLIIISGVLSILSPAFLTKTNLLNVLLSASTIGIVASGMTLVILSGGLDLSVGSMVALSGSLIAVLLNYGISLPVACVITLLLGVVLGGINSFFITKLSINALITTLGTMMIYRGAAYLVAGGSAVYINNDAFIVLGTGTFFSVPNPVIVLIVTFLVFYFALSKTVFGRNVYVIGGNKEAARLCGININKYSLLIYIVSAVMSVIAGVILAGRMTSGQPTAANGLEMDVITAVILGGVAMSGGSGSMVGTILGVLILSVFRNGLLLLNVDSFYQYIASGSLLLFAVAFDQIRNKK